MQDQQNIEFKHELPAQFRFSDIDQFGHVNNNAYFSLFDMCKTRYFLDVAGHDIFQRITIVVANINANVKSVRFELGNRVRMQLRIIPELKFFVDDSLDYDERIGELLK